HNTPIHITTQGHITTTDPGQPNTLHLAPKHRRDGTLVTTDPDDPRTSAALTAAAIDVIQQHGGLDVRHLLTYVSHETFPARKFAKALRKRFTDLLNDLGAVGELWGPLYRGTRRTGKFSEQDIDAFTAWLYRRVSVGDRATAPTIARNAHEAGFVLGFNELVADIKQAMAAAEKDGRRHPELSMTKPGHRPQIEELTDRILANNGDRTLKDTIADLIAANVHGEHPQFKALVDARKQALKDDPELEAAAQAQGLPTLSPTGEFLGRRLNADTPTDHDFISKLAYAAAWENKTATPDDITETLQREGI
ncbi:hypothetical protein DMC64_42460, partial [Amycolatopsis sp. WAC 04197]|uniref:hypothetical protein n=1 Tax=Amycolatopsis sp. WAC 04197 TaxID=2203199 RepID=UPI001001103E